MMAQIDTGALSRYGGSLPSPAISQARPRSNGAVGRTTKRREGGRKDVPDRAGSHLAYALQEIIELTRPRSRSRTSAPTRRC